MDQIVPNGQVLMVAFKLLQKEARPPVVTLGPNSQDVSECPLNVEMSKDRLRCLSVRLRQNREMCVTNPALGAAKSVRDHFAFSNLCQAAPMKGSNEVSRNAGRYRYAPSSDGGEDRPPGYSERCSEG